VIDKSRYALFNMTVYQELVAAAETTDFAPKSRSESKELYLARLTKAVYKADKTVWESLTEPAQRWYIESARRINARLPVESCPGYDEAVEAHLVPDNNGLTEAVRTAVLLNPDSSRDEILRQLSEQGWDPKHLHSNQTVTVVRSVTLATIKIAKKIGRWKEEVQA
jgi:hypothetical protein